MYQGTFIDINFALEWWFEMKTSLKSTIFGSPEFAQKNWQVYFAGSRLQIEKSTFESRLAYIALRLA